MQEKTSCIYPGYGEVGHELLKGPRLLCLLLVVQRDLLAELPGIGATCARGAGHCAGRSLKTLAGGRKVEDRSGDEAGGCLSSKTSLRPQLQTH